MKKIVILGSTGSLGTLTLELLDKYNKHFKVIGLSANKNSELLQEQAKKFNVKNIVLASRDGEEKLIKLASPEESDIIVNVLSGIAGIEPTMAALKAGKTLLLGNKESLVAEGEKIMADSIIPPDSDSIIPPDSDSIVPPDSDSIIPLDSEHNAIFEILKNNPNKTVKKIILPCSGGPFLGKTKRELEKITAQQAIAHPKWKMGAKISLESATLINKGLEVIEAHYLFNIPLEKIEVKIHPECLLHGIVEFEDGLIGYISEPDMREHIENALLRAANLSSPSREIRLIKMDEFNLQEPDHKTFPGIKIVINSFKKNHRNLRNFLRKEEKILQKFIDAEINFPEIFELLA